MQRLEVDSLVFYFPDDWMVTKYDEWCFYKKNLKHHDQVITTRKGIKGVDILAISPDKKLWLIEAKDYSQHKRTKPISIEEEVYCKVFDTLALLLPAKYEAEDHDERQIASLSFNNKQIRVVCCYETSKNISENNARQQLALYTQKFKQIFKIISPRVYVVNSRCMSPTFAWTVEINEQP